MTKNKVYAKTSLDLERERRERKFNRELKKKRKELEELAFLKTYQTKMSFMIKFLEMDIEDKLTLTEKVVVGNAIKRSMDNNWKLKESTYGDGKRNKECHIVEEAEALSAFYRYHGYNHEELSSRDEEYILKKIRKNRAEGLLL